MTNNPASIRFVRIRNHSRRRRRRRRRRGASEVLGALIIAVITIAGFTAYAGTLFNQTKIETSSITEALRKGAIKQGQFLTPLYHWESIEGTQTRIEVSIYNYGYTDAKPKQSFEFRKCGANNNGYLIHPQVSALHFSKFSLSGTG